MANPFDDYVPHKNYGSVTGQSSGFDSRTPDSNFSHMRQQISDACLEINSQTNELKSLCKKIGGKQDDSELRRRIHELRKSTFDKVEATTELFNALIGSYADSNDRGHKIAIESLRKNFSKTANDFSQVYENIVNRLQDNPRPKITDSYVAAAAANEKDDQVAILQAEQHLETQGQIHVSYAEERAQMMDNLANDMVQLHDIMNSIQNMVVEQGENIDQIEQHVERAAVEVEKGRSELGTAVRYKKCNRRLTLFIICIVSSIVIAIVIVIVILVCAVGGHCSNNNK